MSAKSYIISQHLLNVNRALRVYQIKSKVLLPSNANMETKSGEHTQK